MTTNNIKMMNNLALIWPHPYVLELSGRSIIHRAQTTVTCDYTAGFTKGYGRRMRGLLPTCSY